MDANAASLRAIDSAVQHPCVAVLLLLLLLLLRRLDATIRSKVFDSGAPPRCEVAIVWERRYPGVRSRSVRGALQ